MWDCVAVDELVCTLCSNVTFFTTHLKLLVFFCRSESFLKKKALVLFKYFRYFIIAQAQQVAAGSLAEKKNSGHTTHCVFALTDIDKQWQSPSSQAPCKLKLQQFVALSDNITVWLHTVSLHHC